MKKIFFSGVLALAVLADNHASVLFQDDFNYADGDLTTVSGGTWFAISGAGAMPIQVLNDQVILNQGAGSREDDSALLGATMGAGDIWFYSLQVSVTSNNSNVYFASFQESSSIFNARLFVTAFGGSDFTFGIGETSTLGATWGTGLTYGVTYTVVVGYEFDTGITTLWVNPIDQSSTSVSFDGVNSDEIVQFGLRQATGATSTQTIGSVVVGTSFGDVIPEPTTAALLVGGLGSMVWIRRRRLVL
jgi:hypothetical protein